MLPFLIYYRRNIMYLMLAWLFTHQVGIACCHIPSYNDILALGLAINCFMPNDYFHNICLDAVCYY